MTFRRAAWLAFILGIGHAAVSAYWGSGGTWLLDTLGGSLEDAARRGGPGVAVALWAVALLKVAAAVLPLLATRPQIRHRRALRALAWIQAWVLTGYGLVLTGAGLLVQAGIVSSASADHHALAWHAYLWDPWFLVWGLLCIVALRGSHRAVVISAARTSTLPTHREGRGPARRGPGAAAFARLATRRRRRRIAATGSRGAP